METRAFPLKLKSVAADGTFVGFGSTYGNTDLQGDIVQPGAFAQSIQSQGNGYPLLWVHNQETPLGIAKISDSKSGLLVEGSMLMSDPNAQRVNAFMKMGSVKGLSIGFASPDPAKTSYDEDGNRILREIKLYELSLCPIPANPLAVVTSVKSLAQVERFMQAIRTKAAPLDDETRAHVQAIHEHVLSLLGIADDEPLDEDEEDDPENDPDLIDEDAAKAILMQLQEMTLATK
jgi:uncharacterized protein